MKDQDPQPLRRYPAEPRRASAFQTILRTILLAALFLVTLWLAVEVGAGVARMLIELEALQATAEDRARW